jgi:hypothetical protein
MSESKNILFKGEFIRIPHIPIGAEVIYTNPVNTHAWISNPSINSRITTVLLDITLKTKEKIIFKLPDDKIVNIPIDGIIKFNKKMLAIPTDQNILYRLVNKDGLFNVSVEQILDEFMKIFYIGWNINPRIKLKCELIDYKVFYIIESDSKCIPETDLERF